MTDLTPILVVDDDDDVREMLALVLQAEGFSVTTAWNGQLALQQLAAFSGVVLLDLRMPVMSGWDVIDVLRANGRIGSIPIAICTSSPEDAPVGFPIIPKPVDLDQMLGTIRGLASQSPVPG